MKYRFNVPHQSEVPFETHQGVIERLLATERLQAKRLGKEAAMVNSRMNEYRANMQKQIGADKFKRFRQYITQQKLNQAKNLLPPKGPAMSLNERKHLLLQRQKASLTFLHDLGVDIDEIKRLNRNARNSLAWLKPPVPKRDGKPVVLVLPKDVPLEIRSRKTNPWDIRTPPYLGGTRRTQGYAARFKWIPTFYLNPASGYIGNGNYAYDSDASDSDIICEAMDTLIYEWYQMPTNGLVEVYIEAQSAENLHSCGLSDEWGWSNSVVRQSNNLYLRTTTPDSDDTSDGMTTSWSESGKTDGSWENHYLQDGATYWVHLFSHAVFPANSWVLLEIGTHNYNFCWANDVEVYSNVRFKWFIKSVYIQSTG